jgi:hypothetical protein
MAVLFDSKTLPAGEADEALTVLFAEGGLPISVSHVRPREAGQSRACSSPAATRFAWPAPLPTSERPHPSACASDSSSPAATR